jgi:hypothetical protein
MTDIIIAHLNRIEQMILGMDSPRLSKDNACKFLKVGRPKLQYLFEHEKITRYIDEWGEEYYLKSDLINYLESNGIRRR